MLALVTDPTLACSSYGPHLASGNPDLVIVTRQKVEWHHFAPKTKASRPQQPRDAIDSGGSGISPQSRSRVSSGSYISLMRKTFVPKHEESCQVDRDSPNPAARFLLWATGRAQRAGKPPGSWHHARPSLPETSRRGTRGSADAPGGQRSLAGSRAGRTAACTVGCGSADARVGIEPAGAVITLLGGSGR